MTPRFITHRERLSPYSWSLLQNTVTNAGIEMSILLQRQNQLDFAVNLRKDPDRWCPSLSAAHNPLAPLLAPGFGDHRALALVPGSLIVNNNPIMGFT